MWSSSPRSRRLSPPRPLARSRRDRCIEVHGDRLVGSLCSAILNQRTDEYGGSFENRVRYALEVVAAIKGAAPQLMVEYKLPVIMENPRRHAARQGGLQPDEACEFAKLLEARAST